ncbi:MAG: GumC family protein [Alphaproteobacteria bacterium]
MENQLSPQFDRGAAAPAAWSPPMPSPYYNGSNGELWPVAVKLWQRKWIVLGVTAACTLAAGIVTAMLTPRYTAESQVLVGVQTPRVLSVDTVLSGLTANSETVQSEAYIMTSRATAEKVARGLELDKVPEFNAALRPKSAFDISRLPGVSTVKSWLKPPPPQAAAGSGDHATKEDVTWNRVVSTLLGSIQVTPLNRSHIVSIKAESENPQLAARIANGFASAYIGQQMTTKQSTAAEADQWLDQRIAKLRKQVATADAAVETFRRENGLYETKSDTVVAQQLAELTREMLAAQNAKVEAEARRDQARAQIKNTDSMESLPSVLQSPVIHALRTQQSQLEQKSAQLASSYTSKHPLRRDIAAQIKDVRSKIRAEAQRIVDGLNHQVQMAQERYRRVQQQMGSLQGNVDISNEKRITLNELEREAQASRGMLVSLLQRSKETVDQQTLMTPDARVTSQADIPLSPSYPKTGLMIILAAFAGMTGGTLLALLLEGADQSYRNREEIEHDTGLPVLSIVPSVSRNERRKADRRAPYWESLQMLNTRLSLRTAREGGVRGSVLFTSAQSGEGKTNLSTAYARLLALEGHRVVIVELDWKRPSLHTVLGQPQRVGLAELLHGYVTPEESVYRDPSTGLHAIFAGNGDHIAKSGVWLARLRLLLGTLSRHYDIIVLDTAPASATPEILRVSQLVEQTVFVVKWRSTPRRAVINELRNLQHAGADIAGVVFSQVNLGRYRQYAYGNADYRRRNHLAYDAG